MYISKQLYMHTIMSIFCMFCNCKDSLRTYKICLHPQMHAQETLIWRRNKKEENLEKHLLKGVFLRNTLKHKLFMCAEHFTGWLISAEQSLHIPHRMCTCTKLSCLRTYNLYQYNIFCWEYTIFVTGTKPSICVYSYFVRVLNHFRAYQPLVCLCN